MKKRRPERRFYYIEHHIPAIAEPIELYTWEDVREVAAKYQQLHPEQDVTIREFEPI